MSQELIYTSAPRGLKPGSRGFCTVVSTFGMAANMAQRLESLSGYRHVYGPQESDAHLNPVVFSHLRLTVGGRMYHVLSRIADAGLDYTQRTNKLAHHVVLDVAERVPGGPAWLLRQPGFLATAFDGEPRVLPAGRKPPAGDETPGVCRRWARLTGDAGWGGALAEAAASGRKAYLVFRPGMEPLPLLAESFALLPPERRWNVTFSTYFTGLPPGLDCQVACVLDGSPEHARMRRTRDALVIDLFHPAGPSPESAYTQAARSGDVAGLTGAASRPGVHAPAVQPPAAPGGLEEALQGLATETAPTGETAAGPPPRGGATGSPPPLGPPSSSALAKGQAGVAPRRFRRKDAAKWPYVLLASVAVLILLGSGAALWTASRGGTGSPEHGSFAVERDGEQGKPAEVPVAQPEEQAEPDEPVEPEQPVEPEEPVQPEEPEEPVEPEHPVESDGSLDPETVDEREKATVEPAESPQCDEPREWAAEKEGEPGKPQRAADSDQSPEPAPVWPAPRTDPAKPIWPEAVEIVSEDGKPEQERWYDVVGPGLLQGSEELELRGLDKVFSREPLLTKDASGFDVSGSTTGERRWSVSVGNIDIAMFGLREQGIRFRWADRLLADWLDPLPLRNCQLVVRQAGRKEPVAEIALRKPIRAQKVPLLNFLNARPGHRTTVSLKDIAVPDLPSRVEDHLRWVFLPGTVKGAGPITHVTFSTGPQFSVSVAVQEEKKPIIAMLDDIKLTFNRDGMLQGTCSPALTISPPIIPWGRSKPEPLAMPAIDTLHRTAQNRDPDDVQRAKHFVHNETKKDRKDRDEQKLKQARNIIERYHEYRNRIQRLHAAFSALGEVFVLYHVYVDLGNGAKVLLVKGIDDP